MTIQDYFDQHIERKASGCWLWIGAPDAHGYARFYQRGPHYNQKAHRVSWVLHRGEIGHGLHVCHTCDIRHCVNPAHLFLGTNADNVADKVSKGRASRTQGTQNGCAKLTEADVIAIRAASGTQVAIARAYEVSRSLVSAIQRRKQWAHLTGNSGAASQ